MSERRPYSALFVVGLQEDGTTKCVVASSSCRLMYAGMPQRKNSNDLRSVLAGLASIFIFLTVFYEFSKFQVFNVAFLGV